VRWRADYATSRQEAQKTGRPLFLDVSTEWCGPCRKLESTTFRDPAIVRMLNEQFVPLKVDGTKDKVLTEALKVQGYPTLILAGPDGKILQTIEGYVDAARFREHLQGALNIVANPEWLQRNYQDAAKAAAAGDYARAITFLRAMLEDRQNRPIQQQALVLLQDIELQANQRLLRARQMEDRGQYLEALDSLSELMQTFAGTQAANEAGQIFTVLADKPEVKSQRRRQRAAELLAQAKNDFRSKQYLCCLDRCQLLSVSFGDLPEGNEAVLLLEQIKNDPEWLRNACEVLSERLGDMYLAQAESWMRKGQTPLALQCLERVIATLPNSRYAEMAKVRLAQIQGRPSAYQVEFEK
jgi:outer membrane protein assembly factor BamD (BamD/ComL family)